RSRDAPPAERHARADDDTLTLDDVLEASLVLEREAGEGRAFAQHVTLALDPADAEVHLGALRLHSLVGVPALLECRIGERGEDTFAAVREAAVEGEAVVDDGHRCSLHW